MAEKLKQFWKSKAFWGGVLAFIGYGLQGIGIEPIGSAIIGLGIALGFVGVRDASKKIKWG